MQPLRLAILRLAGDLARDQMRRALVAVGVWTIAFLLVLTAIGFALGGIYSAFEAPLGPVAASFILAGIAVAIALLLIFVGSRNLSRGRRRRHEAMDEFADGHPRATGLADVTAAFAFGLAKGLAKRRKS